MISKEFVMAGNATFTLEMPETFRKRNNLPTHYTYKVVSRPDRFHEKKLIHFVSLMTGYDNVDHFSYLGMLKSNGDLILTKGSKFNKTTWSVRLLTRVLDRVWNNEFEEISKAGFVLHHEGKCGKCGRKLTTPESVKTGLGPKCYKAMSV